MLRHKWLKQKNKFVFLLPRSIDTQSLALPDRLTGLDILLGRIFKSTVTGNEARDGTFFGLKI